MKFKTMRNLPSQNRPSTKILRELLRVRLDLIETEKARPYIKNLDTLLKKDFWLSDALIRFLDYELGLNIEFPADDPEEETF